MGLSTGGVRKSAHLSKESVATCREALRANTVGVMEATAPPTEESALLEADSSTAKRLNELRDFM